METNFETLTRTKVWVRFLEKKIEQYVKLHKNTYHEKARNVDMLSFLQRSVDNFLTLKL